MCYVCGADTPYRGNVQLSTTSRPRPIGAASWSFFLPPPPHTFDAASSYFDLQATEVNTAQTVAWIRLYFRYIENQELSFDLYLEP